MSLPLSIVRGALPIAASVLFLTGCEFSGQVSQGGTAQPENGGSSSSGPAAPGESGNGGAQNGGGAGSGGGSGSLPRCRTADLRVNIEALPETSTQGHVNLILTNTSTHDCRTGGYVGLQLINPGGGPVTTSVVRQGTPKTITLTPRGDATAELFFATGGDDTTCPEVTQIRVIPPNETAPLTAQWNGSNICGNGRISTHPLITE